MAAEVIHVQWYATVLQGNTFAEAVSEFAAPLTLKYGALKYSVMRSIDDPYRITQQIWFDDHDNWYRYWDGPEMIEFRAKHSRHFQIPVVYFWSDEIASGALGPEVPTAEAEPEPAPEPSAAA
jgi:quinol monooxygenase YgiN